MEKLNVAIADDNEKMVEVLGQIIEKRITEKKSVILYVKRNRTLWFWILLCRKWTDWQ